ncbi:DNA mismatch repair protein PMS1 isoform X3 [Andrographis paniculata]|uniref:DNA mismatch repair protein PMS1 isoform X3 n=1 Tax=Andrographis paniculata TaxID=175694 RepID=UPI0021E6EBB9|nr:DNA mismatch repair protein PMS1 isoform X3 [Andrographis paniculata]
MKGGVEESPAIRPINKAVVHQICAGQVILDLSSAVKELVENSLDAGATSVEIALKDYGMESFQVIDNGFGISPQNYNVLALKHHTSKLLDFPDLQSLATFGFRGEALSSLCALGNLTVETRTINEAVATHLTYDSTGLLTAERKTARQVGTTVTVKKLFSNLPVRSKEFHRNIRKEYGKLINLLNAYALIAKDVRIVCTNTTGKNIRSVVIKTQGNGSLKENIITVFGTSTFSCLEPVKLNLSDGYTVEGFVSKSGYGSGRNMGDRQFFFVNGRPVDMPKVDDKLCENGGFVHAKAQADVRDSSDMDMIQGGGSCSVIEEFALGVKDNQKHNLSMNSEKKIMSFSCDNANKHAAHLSKSTQKGNIYSNNSCGCSTIVQMSLDKFVSVNKRKHECIETALSEMPLLRNGPTLDRSIDNHSPKQPASAISADYVTEVDDFNRINSMKIQPAKSGDICGEVDRSIMLPCEGRKHTGAGDHEGGNVLYPCVRRGQNGATEKINLQDQKVQERAVTTDLGRTASVSTKSLDLPDDQSDAPVSSQPSAMVTDTPTVSSGSKVGFTAQFSFKDLMSRKQRLSRFQRISHRSEKLKLEGSCFASASLELSQVVNEEEKSNQLAAATSELERLFKKEDFKQMKVIGQFNLGFIIGKLDDDLFIVDQHAADEKYNYERLSQTTILNQQPLLRPLKLELSPEEEIVISMHMDIFRKNGFILEEDMHAPSGSRYLLKAVPFSKNITFGIADVKELISILTDSHGECSIIGSYKSDTADSVCPPKVRAMLASRACRSSVMIGDSLGRKEMQKILEHLAQLKSPWNCPHGRPTMRHLVDLRSLHRRTFADTVDL